MRFKFNLIQLTRWVKNPVQGIQLGFLTSWADNSSTRVPSCLGVWVEMDEKYRKEGIKGEVYENKQSSNYCWNSLWQKEPTGRLTKKNDGLAPHNLAEQIWGKLENKQDKSVSCQKEKLWLELQKRWEKIDVKELYDDVLLWLLQRADEPNIQVKRGSKQKDWHHLVAVSQPSAYFMNFRKSNGV